MATLTPNKTRILFTDFENKPRKMDQDAINPTRLLSSTSLDVNIVEIPDQYSNFSVSAVLDYCKRSILRPYMRLLSVVGLRPLIANQQEASCCIHLLNNFYSLQLIVLLIIGYFLQYMACFRRDRGFCYKVPERRMYQTQLSSQTEMKEIYEKNCHGPILFSFILPSLLHFFGYLHALVAIRHSDDDQMPTLMERVFLLSTNLSNGFLSQKRLVRTLWFFVSFTGVWMILSLISVIFMMAEGNITFKWVENIPTVFQTVLKTLLVVCTLWHDIVQAAIISNYCLQTQLLTAYLQFLQEKLLLHPVQPIDWLRHIESFKKMLNYVNNEMAPAVCIFTFINIACALSGLLWIFNYDHVDTETVPIMGISALNIALWVIIALAPFIQASRLSNQCQILRSAGQEARARPFVHQDTPGYELDSILLYTASLKLRAKLFYVPITGNYLCLFFMMVGVSVLVLGQCHYLTPAI